MLYFVGLGLADEKDVTLKGHEIIKRCAHIYLECYTSILEINKESLEKFYEKKIFEADREFVESGCEEMIEKAKTEEVAFCVVGDVFSATTHSDLFLRCRKENVNVEVVPNASIITAMGITGLQLYRFGEIVSIPFFTEKWKPYSFIQKVLENYKRGLHTLLLLDIKVKEPTMESILKKKKDYMEPRFMSTKVAAEQIVEALGSLTEETKLDLTSKCFGLARVGSKTQGISSGPLSKFLELDMGAPLHSFIICGELHPIEEEMYDYYSQNTS